MGSVNSNEKSVSVIGSADAGRDSQLYRVALEVGKIAAQKGYVLINGGLFGVMEASSKGAFENGGITVGILPNYGDVCNDYLTVKIKSGLNQCRNILIVSSSDIIIAIGGGYGTLSEIGHALKLGKTVVGFKTWNVKGLINYESESDFISYLDSIL